MKKRRPIEIVPVWHKKMNRGLYVLALLALVEQMADEAKTGPRRCGDAIRPLDPVEEVARD